MAISTNTLPGFITFSISRLINFNSPQLFTASVPRADVWVFDPANLGSFDPSTYAF